MAAGEDYLSLVGKEGLNELELAKKSAQELGNIVVDVNGKVAALYGKFKDQKSLKDFNKQYEDARKLVDELNASTKAYEKSLADEAKQRALNAKATQEEEKAKQQKLKTDKLVNAEAEKEKKNNKQLLTDYQLLSKAYLDARDKYRAYALVLGQTHPLTVQAAEDARRLNDTLKKLDAATGDFRRNVGNYNSVGMQFNQLLREAPNFAQSFRIGLQSLTNNISYFAEAVQKARKDGESWGQILKNVGSSFVGLVGIINIAVLAVTYFTNKAIKENTTAVGQSEKANKKYAESLKSIEDNSMSAAAEEISRIKVLTAVATDETETREKRNQAVDKLQKMYPNYLGNIDDETIKSGQAEDAIRKLTQAITQKAVAEAASQKYAASYLRQVELSKANEKAVLEEVNARKELNKVNNQIFKSEEERGLAQFSAQERLTKAKADRALVENEYDMAIREANNFQNLAEDAMKKIPALFDKPKREKAATDTVNAEINQQERLNKALAEKRKIDLEDNINKSLAIIEDEQNSLDKRLDAVVQYFESKRALNNIDMNAELSTIQYKLDRIEEIEAKSAAKRTKQERALLSEKEVLEAEKTAITAKYAIKENDITADAIKREKKAVDKAIDDAEKAEKLKQDNLAAVRIKAGKDWDKFQKDEKKKEEERIKERIALLGKLRDAANQIFSSLKEISDNKFNQDMDKFDREEEKIEKDTELRIKALEKQGLSEEEYDKRKQDIEADAENRKNLLAQREATRQQRKAQFDKEMAILQATLSLYIGIAQELEKGVVGIATGAAVAAYMATVIATLSSTSTPQYGDGTPAGGHKGGDAIIGERYEPEQVTLPSGQQYIVSTPTYVKNLPAGTDVTPLAHMVGYNGRPVARGQYGDTQALQNAVRNGVSEGLSKQAVHKTVLTQNGLRYVVKNGNTQTTYFNANNA